jgi:RNA recognition motif-containing protein
MSARTKEDIKRTLAAWFSITVQNLHPSVTAMDLLVIFQHCGPIKDYFIEKTQGFVAFECEDDADEAVKLDGIRFRNHLKVRRFDPQLDMVLGDDEMIRHGSDRGASSRDFHPAFERNREQFKEAPSAMRSTRIGDGYGFEDKRMKFVFQNESMIVVRNLDVSVQEEELLDEFAKFSKPVWASIFKRDYELSAASSHINFGTPEEAANIASKYPVLDMFGRQINISVANPANDDEEPNESKCVTYFDPNKHHFEQRPHDQSYQVYQFERNYRGSFMPDYSSRRHEDFHQHGAAVGGTSHMDRRIQLDYAESNRVDRKQDRSWPNTNPSPKVEWYGRAAHSFEASFWPDFPQEPSHASSSWAGEAVDMTDQGAESNRVVDRKQDRTWPNNSGPSRKVHSFEASWPPFPQEPIQVSLSWAGEAVGMVDHDGTFAVNSAPNGVSFGAEASWHGISASQHGSDHRMTVNPAANQQVMRLMNEQQEMEMMATARGDGEIHWGDQGRPWDESHHQVHVRYRARYVAPATVLNPPLPPPAYLVSQSVQFPLISFGLKSLQDFDQQRLERNSDFDGHTSTILENMLETEATVRRVYSSETCHKCRKRTHLFPCQSQDLDTNRLCHRQFCGNCLESFKGNDNFSMPGEAQIWRCPYCLKICRCQACQPGIARSRSRRAVLPRKTMPM